ncbi:Vacuolar protein sorting-associated protein 52 like [Schistosoma japonicum]|nr:Vacuolar protein sorting-associated protein 52 like [Schistosoma japonicum]KAH8868358.1 Vacuolar protein sorting-associated protein 52 like [Schistosoma japonicum]KAH8868359.1 Vacuolar protein sorting-associated protein 52 like [Schistosoma japonicum]
MVSLLFLCNINIVIPESLKTEIEEIALKSGIDVRDYAAQVESELMKIEESLIKTYITVSPEVASLHNQITSCDAILERIENILTNFHEDLGAISTEIQDLQSKSLLMNTRLQNRQTVRSNLSQFLSDMAIPEELIRHIMYTPVTEQEFLENLHELNHKMNFALGQSMVDYKSFNDVSVLLKKLKIKAVTKIREFLLGKIYALRKPLTNYQVPQNQLLKFRFYNSFLLAHDREIAREIKVEYINTMSKVYYAYFKAYCGKLTKLQLDTTYEKDDLLGKNPEKYNSASSASSVMFNSITNVANNSTMSTPTNSGTRVGLFGLSDRALRVLSKSNLENTIILPHVASNVDAKYPIEVLFRSIHYALLDTVCREYYFLSDFFHLSAESESNDLPSSPGQNGPDQVCTQSGVALAHFFEQVMCRSLNWIQKFIETFIISSCSYDAIGLLICLQLLHAFLRLAKERGVPVLDSFWGKMTETLWVRVTDRLDVHISSMLQYLDVSSFSTDARNLVTSNLSTSNISAPTNTTGTSTSGLHPKIYALIRPHSIARRYAELAASLHSIGHQFPGTPLFDDSVCKSKSSESSNLQHSLHTTSAPQRNNTNLNPGLDPRILSRLAQLQTQFEHVLNSLAKTFSRPKLAHIFLINNYDLVISVLTEHGASDSSEVIRCQDAVAKHTASYIDEALSPYFGCLISFVRDVEIRSTSESLLSKSQDESAQIIRSEEARVTRIVKGFNIDWKNSIEKIHDEIMMEFANFTLGTQIFQALLAQLIQHYHRFQKVMTQSPYKNMPIRNQLVNIHQITNEIKKCKTNFS